MAVGTIRPIALSHLSQECLSLVISRRCHSALYWRSKRNFLPEVSHGSLARAQVLCWHSGCRALGALRARGSPPSHSILPDLDSSLMVQGSRSVADVSQDTVWTQSQGNGVNLKGRRAGGITRHPRGAYGRAFTLREVWEGPPGTCCCCQPDSGNPTVRDERGAYGNVNQGGIRNPLHIPKGCKSETLHLQLRASYFYPTAISQQGLATTCRDPSTRGTGVGGRVLVWRMSPYER